MFVVHASPIHGLGCFALEGIPSGTRVAEYTGERITQDEADRRYADDDVETHRTYLFTVDRDTVVDGGVDGNDAAEAVAFGVGGGGLQGRAQFISWMNEKVAILGLRDTRFANPSGLDDTNQFSTAYDLAVMGAYALGKPELRKTFGTKDVVIAPSKEPGREHGWFNPGNLNSLLWSYRGALGIKPGYTEDAGYTLVGAAERDGRTLVCVTLNSRRHFGDCTALLDFGFKRLTQT